MIVCVGVGPGHFDYLTNKALQLLQDAEVVAGFDSVLNIVAPVVAKQAQLIAMNYKDQIQRLAQLAELHHAGKKCVVAFMGDIHFSGFQYLERVERACGHIVDTIPGISSAQILASKARVCFDETSFLTFHRRGNLSPFKQHLVRALNDERNVMVIPHPWDFMPATIASYLVAEGISPALQVEVWENLTGIEAHWSDSLAALSKSNYCFSDMSIMLIRCRKPLARMGDKE